MGKYSTDVRKIYKKKQIKAKEKLKKLETGEISYTQLNRLAKKLFYNRLKAGYEFPARIFSSDKKSSGGVA